LLNAMQLVQETMAKFEASYKASMADPNFKKAIDLATGLTGFNLQAPAKQLVPLIAPNYGLIPREVKAGADADNWRTITAISMPKLSVGERAAASRFATTLVSKVASFAGCGLRGEVTLEAQKASEGFDDALAKETGNCLLNAMRMEWGRYLGGNVAALGAPGTPTVAEVEGVVGATIGASAHFVAIRALTLEAANRVTVDIPGGYGAVVAANALLAGKSIAALNPLVDDAGASITVGCGISALGAEGTVTTTGAGNSLKITWAATPGAVAYAVFVGTTTGAANLKLEAIVGQTSVTLTSLGAGGIVANHASLPTTDETDDALSYDGIIKQLLAGGSGAYVINLSAPLSGTAALGEIPEIQQAFAVLYQTNKIGKFRLIVSAAESRGLTKLGVISGAMQIFAQPGPTGRTMLTAGAHVGEIINATTGDVCPIDVDPWLPPGTLLILPTEIPYKDANISSPFKWVGSFDWTRWDYASTVTTGPVYPFETRCRGVLEGQFTGGCGILYNIFNV
jgi:hypothetical protein